MVYLGDFAGGEPVLSKDEVLGLARVWWDWFRWFLARVGLRLGIAPDGDSWSAVLDEKPKPCGEKTVMNRRTFLLLGAGAVCGLGSGIRPLGRVHAEESEAPFRISLAEWSLNNSLRAGAVDNLDFPVVARRDYGIDCVELVDQFLAGKAKDDAYLGELKRRAEDEGVRIHLIMLDTNGPLGAERDTVRRKSIDRTLPWIDAAAFLGCSTVRVNARGDGTDEELKKRIAASCAELADYAAKAGLNLTIENHGGPSSNPDWLIGVFNEVAKPNFGALPDFGNFPDEVNRYDAVEAMMPYAKAVSAKASRFTDDGLVAETDYFRMMRIVRDGGYTGYVGIETGMGSPETEPDAIRKTRDLLLRIRDEEARRLPIFNGRDLTGWELVHGGEWSVDDGVLVGRNGCDWSTNPETTGSWLRTAREYGDFRLELQYMISEGGNSGVFFRSALEKNPAFTGYEMQIYDAPGTPSSKGGPSALYDVIAPTKNLVRPAGQWNTVTITAKGSRAMVEMNGEIVVDTEIDRATRGYIGLQNHDEKAVVRFRNIRIEDL